MYGTTGEVRPYIVLVSDAELAQVRGTDAWHIMWVSKDRGPAREHIEVSNGQRRDETQ